MASSPAGIAGPTDSMALASSKTEFTSLNQIALSTNHHFALARNYFALAQGRCPRPPPGRSRRVSKRSNDLSDSFRIQIDEGQPPPVGEVMEPSRALSTEHDQRHMRPSILFNSLRIAWMNGAPALRSCHQPAFGRCYGGN